MTGGVDVASACGLAALTALTFLGAPAHAADVACGAAEETVFACSTGAKRVAVCASKGLAASGGQLQYRFGRPGAPELVLPGAADDWRAGVQAGTLMYSGGGGAWMAFGNGDYRYVVYTAIVKGSGSRAGVAVEQAGRRIAHLRCKGEPQSLLGPDFFGRAAITEAGGGFELP